MSTTDPQPQDPPAASDGDADTPPAGLPSLVRVLGLVAIGVGLRMLLITWLPPNAVSGDIWGWKEVLDGLAMGENPYSATTRLNWPPVWLQCLWLAKQLSVLLQMDLAVTIRLMLACFDGVLMLVLYAAIRAVGDPRYADRWLLYGIVLNPTLLALTCVHGNFDVLVAIWAVSAVACLAVARRSGDEVAWLAGCLFIGLGILTKTVPLLLLPLLAPGLRSARWGTRALGVTLALAPVTLAMSVIYALTPAAVARNVLGYRSMNGYFGFSGLLHNLGWEGIVTFYTTWFTPLLLLGTAVLCVALWLQAERWTPRRIVVLAPLIFVVLLLFGPSYASQYGYWVVPLAILAATAELRLRLPVIVFLAVAALTYTVEYGFNLHLGAVFANLYPSPPRFDFADWFAGPKVQTWTRLPLFLAYAGLFVALLRALRPHIAKSDGEAPTG